MDKLEIEGGTYKNVTVLPFLLSETASINAAFLPDNRESMCWSSCVNLELVLTRKGQHEPRELNVNCG